MEANVAVQAYRDCEKDLLALRERYSGNVPDDDPEEDAILDRADTAWFGMSEAEVAWVNANPGLYYDRLRALCREAT